MNKAITDSIKFICCIGIFIHHFYLHSPYVGFLGPTACVIFFFLSAYGISVSLEKKPMALLPFIKKRLFKIYLPLLMINTLFILGTGLLCKGYFSIPIFNVFGDNIDFVQNVSTLDLFLYIVGIYKIDGVTWFLNVLFAMYLFLWFIHKMANKTQRIIVTSIAYSIFVIGCINITPPVMFGLIFDPLGIVIGVLFAEKKQLIEYLQSRITTKLIILIGIIVFTLGFLMGTMQNIEGRYTKLILLIVAVLSIIFTAALATGKPTKKFSSISTFLGGISFFVYLTHEKIANIVFYFRGSRSLVLTSIGICIISVVLYLFYQKIIKKIYG